MKLRIEQHYVFERDNSADIALRRAIDETINMLAARLDDISIVERRAIVAVLASNFTIEQWHSLCRTISRAISDRRALFEARAEAPTLYAQAVLGQVDQIEQRWEKIKNDMEEDAMFHALIYEADGMHPPTNSELNRIEERAS